MQNELNTLETRYLVQALLKDKNATFWSSWTNKVQKNYVDVADRRNLCFGIIGEKFTQAECKWIKLLVGCDKVYTTCNGHYLRLLGVKYES